VITGTLASVRGLASPSGLFTEAPDARGVGFPALDELVFGGHEIRRGTLYESAMEIYRETGVLRHDFLLELRGELDAVDAEIRPGTAWNCGRAIEGLTEEDLGDRRPRAALEAIRRDIAAFRERHALDGVVAVNLASTEPPLTAPLPDPEGTDERAIERFLDEPSPARARASTLYALAAVLEGCPYVNFTPSEGALPQEIRALADRRGLPYMGNDGKTGETLVKSALAPLFRYRNLQVLSWQGYNILGDRDGRVLADPENKASKIRTKDEVIPGILGYPVHTHVGIDFVPSLHDQKTAWDFIHFRGFLDVKMSLQFIWQGYDSILAAPVVLDLVRFAELSRRRGEAGPMKHLACYFKNPVGVPQHDLHFQFHALLEYVDGCRETGRG